jgi:hypothetical protein
MSDQQLILILLRENYSLRDDIKDLRRRLELWQKISDGKDEKISLLERAAEVLKKTIKAINESSIEQH